MSLPFLGVVGLSWFGLGAAPSVVPDQPMLGQTAPSFRLADLSGEELALEDLRGRFIVLHFGASW